MYRVGGLACDATYLVDTTACASHALHFLRTDWSAFVIATDVNKYRQPVLDSIAAQSRIKAGSMAKPIESWQFGVRGIPSVSFNTIKKELCACGEAIYHQAPQNIDVNSIEIINTISSTTTLPALIDAHLKEQDIQRHKTDFSRCSTCGSQLPLRLKTTLLDRPPHILGLGLPTSVNLLHVILLRSRITYLSLLPHRRTIQMYPVAFISLLQHLWEIRNKNFSLLEYGTTQGFFFRINCTLLRGEGYILLFCTIKSSALPLSSPCPFSKV